MYSPALVHYMSLLQDGPVAQPPNPKISSKMPFYLVALNDVNSDPKTFSESAIQDPENIRARFKQKCDVSIWMLYNTSKSDRDKSTEQGKQKRGLAP